MDTHYYFKGECMKLRATIKLCLRICIVASAAVWVWGCEKVPDADIKNSKMVLDNANKGMAPQFAATQYNAATASFDRALAEIERQQKTIPFFRKYSAAKRYLFTATLMAQSALDSASNSKTLAHAQAARQRLSAESLVDEIRPLIADAVKQKKNTMHVQSQLDSMVLILTAIDSLTQAGNILVATDMALQVQTGASALKDTVLQLPLSKKKRL